MSTKIEKIVGKVRGWNITDSDIESLVCGFLPSESGGSSYWAVFKSKAVEGVERDRSIPLCEQFVRGQITFLVWDAEDSDEEKFEFEVTIPKLLKGLRLWAGATNRGLGDFGQIDAGDADAILQYALFGECIYG